MFPIASMACIGGGIFMALRYSFEEIEAADKVEKAIEAALEQGLRTKDIAKDGDTIVTTSEMGDVIVAELEALNA